VKRPVREADQWRGSGGTGRFPQQPSGRSPSSSFTLEPMRIPRRLERFILGTMMTVVAIVAERRVVKTLGKKR
jgi:hypothetical protein